MRAIPLFGVLLVIYNAALLVTDMPGLLGTVLLTVGLVSGAQWTLNVSELFIALGVLALYVELFKATRTTIHSVIDHTISTLVFVAFLVEFITVSEAGNSTFLILCLMSLLDVIGGFTITIVAARRDFAVGERLDLQ